MADQISGWLEKFDAALSTRDLEGATQLFDEDCYWRDLVSFTWTLRTFEGRGEIKAMLAATLGSADPSGFVQLGPATQNDGFTEAWFAFETAVGRGTGHLRLKKGKCWTLLTTLQELKGFEERAGPTRERGL